MPRRCWRPDSGVGKPTDLAQPPRPAPPAFHKKEIAGDAAPLGCHPPMDKEHHRASLKSQRENTAATPAVNAGFDAPRLPPAVRTVVGWMVCCETVLNASSSLAY